MQEPHVLAEPGILYFGTPVVLISTCNEDGSANIAPMSSAFWLGWRCMLGLDAGAKTPQNMIRTKECVLNLPSADGVEAVNRLARLTGANPVPERKVRRGYTYEKRKFEVAGLTAVPSLTVQAPRALECPIQLEAVLAAKHGLMEDDPVGRGAVIVFEVRIQRVHVRSDLLMDGKSNQIDPNKWRPLIMSFQRFYGLGPELHDSTLAQIPESSYRGPDIDRARGTGGATTPAAPPGT